MNSSLNPIAFAMRHSVSVMAGVATLAVASALAVRRMAVDSPSSMLGQDARPVPANGNQPGLEKLGIANREDRIWQVDVRDGQTRRLASAQAGSRDQQEDRPQGLRFDARAAAPVRRDRVQQTANLVPRVDVRDERREWLGDDCRQRGLV